MVLWVIITSWHVVLVPGGNVLWAFIYPFDCLSVYGITPSNERIIMKYLCWCGLTEGGRDSILGKILNIFRGGHGGRVVTLSPPTSEAGVRFPARPQVGKLAVACHWLAVYSNLDQLYVLVSSALPATHPDMTCTVLKVT